ncbi:uncharacterized protein LOC117287543 [Asterias rubens]|uniref:uncharacterized protein LOC117287543 n=1 Tax=Asterias rubens TaxID=7604 RepID=UPI001455C9B9|nr:uncharacterized protein LOC117287543 [Asterias rubens]
MGTSEDVVESQIKEYVQQAVGSSSASLVDDIVDKVKEIGIEIPSDFQYMDESDLECLGKSSDGLTASSSSVSPCSSVLSLPDSSPEGVCWSSSYQIPWKKLPKGLQDSIQRKERPLPSERRQMIRVLADDIVKITSRPMRKQLAVVASKVVAEFPSSFQDKLDDLIVDNGYNSILTQLEQRFQNLHRQLKPMKRVNSSSDEAGSSQASNCNKATCSYGTNSEQYSPALPRSEESQEEKKKSLQEMHTREVWKLDTLTELLAETYPTVRHVINGGLQSILSIKEDWPFLFEEVGMLHHFEILVGIKLKETLAGALTSKVPRLLQFLDSKQTTNKQLKLKLHELNSAKRQTSNSSPEILGFLLVLSTFFGENTSALIQSAELLGWDQPQDRVKDKEDMERFHKPKGAVSHQQFESDWSN